MTLSVAEGAGVRRVGGCTLQVDDPQLSAFIGLFQQGDVRVVDFARGQLPSGKRIGFLKFSVGNPGEMLELSRLAKYLHSGMDGRSAPKAAVLRTANRDVRVLLFPPAQLGAPGLDIVAILPERPAPPPAPSVWRPSTPTIEARSPLHHNGGGLPPQWQQPPVAPAAPPAVLAAAMAVKHGGAGRGPPPAFVPLPEIPAAAAAVELAAAAAAASSAGASSVSTSDGSGCPAGFPMSPDGHGREFVPRAQVLAALKSKAATEALAARVAGWISAGRISFPYKRNYTTPVQLEHLYNRVRSMPPPRPGLLRVGPYALHGYQPLMTDSHAVRLGGGDPIECTVDGGVTADSSDSAVNVRLQPTRTASLQPSDIPTIASTAPAYLPFDKEINEDGGHLVDYFSEPARMAARRRDQSQRSDVIWKQPDIARKVVDKALWKGRELTDASLRRGTYGHVPGCNLFHANLASTLYSLLGGTRILDPCAGWGDRLMGALANADVSLYRGFDPNPLLVAPHADMIAMFGPRRGDGSTTSYAVGCVPFEDADVLGSLKGSPFEVAAAVDSATSDGISAATPFDLVLTSPPYFDLELYNETPASSSSASSTSAAAADGSAAVSSSAAAASGAGCGGLESQSITLHGGGRLNSWLEQWYFPMMAKAYSHLTSGGHMAIYINDHVGKPGQQQQEQHEPLLICEPMLRFAASSLPDCVWVGCVGIEGETGSIRPLWIWRKGPPRDGAPLPPLYSIVASPAPAPASSAVHAWRANASSSSNSRKRPLSPEEGAKGNSNSASADPSQAWLHSAFQQLESGDDVARLRQLMSTAPGGMASAVNVQDASAKEHLTILMKACKHGRAQCVAALLQEFGASVNVVAERSSFTALSLAVYSHPQSTALIDTLLAAKADPTVLNKYGESAIRIAETKGHAALAARLKSHAEVHGFGAVLVGALEAAPSPPVQLSMQPRPTSLNVSADDASVAPQPSPLSITVRSLLPSDASAVVALYKECQKGYMEDPANAEGHAAWLLAVLANDLKDVAGHYASIPRAQFWVATIPAAVAAEAIKCPEAAVTAAPPAPAPAPVQSKLAASGFVIPRKSAAAAVPPKAALSPALAPFADASGANVIIGCVAAIPVVKAAAANDDSINNSTSSSSSSQPTPHPRTTPVGELQRMCVHPGLRRCGLASALLAHAEAWASASGYAEMRLSTLATMVPAMALYGARGYRLLSPQDGVPKDYHGHTIRLAKFSKAL